MKILLLPEGMASQIVTSESFELSFKAVVASDSVELGLRGGRVRVRLSSSLLMVVSRLSFLLLTVHEWRWLRSQEIERGASGVSVASALTTMPASMNPTEPLTKLAEPNTVSHCLKRLEDGEDGGVTEQLLAVGFHIIMMLK